MYISTSIIPEQIIKAPREVNNLAVQNLQGIVAAVTRKSSGDKEGLINCPAIWLNTIIDRETINNHEKDNFLTTNFVDLTTFIIKSYHY